MTAVLTLVLITSAGIFGYLSNALLANEDRLEQLLEDKEFLKEELEIQVNDLPENYITAKRKLREEYNPRIQSVNDEILRVKGVIGDLKVELVETGVDVGPAIYLARTFGTEVDSVVKFFIFILIFVFDPLAVMLVVAFNQALLLREENEPSKDSNQVNLITKKAKSWWKFWEMYGEEKPKVSEAVPIYQNTGFRALEDLEMEDDDSDDELIAKNYGKDAVKIK